MPEQSTNRITYSYTGDGNTRLFPILWPYIDKGFVKVTLMRDARDNDPQNITESITWNTDSQIEITPAPPSGSIVTITRQTPYDAPLTVFHDGSNQMADDLNTVGQQFIHITQESRDYTEQVHDYVGKAEGYLEKLEGLDVAVQRAETAAERADQVLNLSIAVSDAPYGHMTSGSYNVETGMLTLRVPKGEQGDRGEQGIQGPPGAAGPKGEDGSIGPQGSQGAPGPSGVVIPVTGIYGFEIDGDDLVLVHNATDTPPNMFIDGGGNLIWEG